jgi:hypothetical protein
MKLTEAQRQMSRTCVAARLSAVLLGGQQNILGRLRNLGLVEYGMCNDTFRITEAGRIAIKERSNG